MAYTPVVNQSTLTLYLGLAATGKAVSGSHSLANVSFGTVYNPRPSITLDPSDVGMPIAIVGGGPVDADMPPVYFVQGGLFVTTIASYVSPTECTLTDAPDTSIYNTGFATVILYRPCPFASDVATLPSGGLGFQYSSSIAPGTSDTLQFTVFNSLGGVDNPYIDRFGAIQLGQPVYLKSSDAAVGDIFGGYIDSLTASSLPGVPGTPYAWSAQCTSWMGLAKRRVVPPAIPTTFLNAAGDEVFRKIVLTYLSDDGVSVTTSGSPGNITLACAVGANIGQLLDQVVALISTNVTAWYWTTDAWRNFILATRSAVSAPWNVSNGDDLLAGQTPYSQSIISTHNQMANTVYAIGQNTLLNTLIANFVGNGTLTVFNTPVNVGAAPSITLNSVAQTVGILGVDVGKDWYWSQGSTAITQATGGTPLTSSDSLVVTYTPETPAVAQNFHVGSLQSQQAIEGTSGEYDYSFSLSQPILPADLLAACTAYEIEYGMPATTCQFYTLRPGLKTGQLQTIALPDAGIPSGDFLIATIQMSLLDGLIVWQYTAFGGANIGDAITALTQFINRAQATGAIVTPATPITAPGQPVAGNFASAPNEPSGIPTPIPFPNGVSTGDLLVAVVCCNNGAIPPTITDTLGNTWIQAVAASGPGFFPNRVVIMYAFSTSAGADAITIHGESGSSTLLSIPGSEIDSASPIDTTGNGSGSAPTITVGHANNVVVTGMSMDASTHVPTVTAPEVLVGYSLGLGPASDGAAAQESIAAAGSFTSTLTSAAVSSDTAYASVSFNRAPASQPPPQTITVQANPQGTVTHSAGALTLNLPVVGNGAGDIKSGTRSGNTTEFASVSAAGTVGQPVLWDANGNVDAGAVGQLVPAGGSSGQVLTKNSSTDYDVSWKSASKPAVHTEPLTDGDSNFIFAAGDIVVCIWIPN